jgi:hypothetical protein
MKNSSDWRGLLGGRKNRVGGGDRGLFIAALGMEEGLGLRPGGGDRTDGGDAMQEKERLAPTCQRERGGKFVPVQY